MEENKQHFWHIISYFSRKVKMQLKCKNKICAVYGEGTVTDQTSQKWFAKFCAGDFSPDNAPRLGRPVEVGSDQTETLTENNQHSTTWQIADILIIHKSIKLLVKMKNVSFILEEKPYRLFGQPNRSQNGIRSPPHVCQAQGQRQGKHAPPPQGKLVKAFAPSGSQPLLWFPRESHSTLTDS